MSNSVPERDYFEALLAELDKRYTQRFQAQEAAIAKADAASEKRFEGVNEFRKTLSDQTGTLLPRSEAEQRFVALSEKLDALRQRVDKSEGTGTGLKAGWGYLVGVIGAVAALMGLVLFKR